MRKIGIPTPRPIANFVLVRRPLETGFNGGTADARLVAVASEALDVAEDDDVVELDCELDDEEDDDVTTCLLTPRNERGKVLEESPDDTVIPIDADVKSDGVIPVKVMLSRL